MQRVNHGTDHRIKIVANPSGRIQGAVLLIASLAVFGSVALGAGSKLLVEECARLLVTAPNSRGCYVPDQMRRVVRELKFKTHYAEIGRQPGTRLAYYRVDPHRYAVDNKFHGLTTKYVENKLNVTINLDFKITDNGAYQGPTRGTIVMLHGFGRNKTDLLLAAMCMADRGYRVIVPDLRGHGNSTVDRVSFGPRESRDVRDLIDFLQKKGAVAGPVGILGVSMGGAVALDCAAADDRIKTVVAIEPMQPIAEVLRQIADTPSIQWIFFGSDRITPWLLKQLSAGKMLEPVVARAGELTGQPILAFDPRKSVAATNKPILLIHGTKDQVVPLAFTSSLLSAAPNKRSKLLTYPSGHIELPLQLETWRTPMQDWFDRNLRP